MVAVLLVDDQPLLRLGFRTLIDQQPDLSVVGEAGDGAEAVTLVETLAPDVVLMDVRMPRMDGIEATRRIVASGSSARVLVLTTFDLDEYVYAALRAGASGFLIKDALPADLLNGIRVVAAGEAAVAPAVTRRLIERFAPHLTEQLTPNLEHLTPREQEVLVEVARGHSNREIAERIYISEATVKVHVGRILTKLDLRDRAQVIVYAYENGIVHPGT
jgi:DNA-binding NarL/FixJ family response regulator